MRQYFHCEKYSNSTQFPGVEVLWKGAVSALQGTAYAETVPFHKISTPGN